MKKNIIISILLAILFFLPNACRIEPKIDDLFDDNSNDVIDLDYASSFGIQENDSTLIYERYGINDTISLSIPKSILPLKNVLVMSSSVLGYFDELEAFDNIKGIYNSNWVYSPEIHKRIHDKKIEDLGNSGTINLEQILIQKPDAIITFSVPNQAKILESASKEGVYVIYIDEFLEKTPLGKAEYIKLFGKLFDKEDLAENKFWTIEDNYKESKDLASEIMIQPLVFNNIMRGDIWYMPGGRSFAAQYIYDAGGNYLWGENEKTNSLQLNFEQVLERAQGADFWINASDFTTLKQLQNSYPNHELFDAFQNENVYSHSKRINENGANDYFETGNVRPDLVLKDLIKIIHPSVYPKYQLYFYQKLK